MCVQCLGLWNLYTDMELSMIPVLAGEVSQTRSKGQICRSFLSCCVVSVMESYHIHVDKEAFQRTSDMLGVSFFCVLEVPVYITHRLPLTVAHLPGCFGSALICTPLHHSSFKSPCSPHLLYNYQYK